MRVVIQRVNEASVQIDRREYSKIGRGLMILVGICDEDTDEDIEYLCQKVVKMRLFPDEQGVMNLPITDISGGGILIVSQFTLMASTKKGNRPSYIRASRPEFAEGMYEKFVSRIGQLFSGPVRTGVFGADMQISLVNDGPVTIIMDSLLRSSF